MQLKQLGATGIMLPEIALGTWKYRAGSGPLVQGIELGANFIDTAEIYRTEETVKEAIKDRRDRVFVATKVAGDHLRHDDLLRAADRSLQRLGVSTIDLYQIHWPDPNVPIKETMRAMETLVDRGLVRFIGVSNFTAGEMEQAQASMSKYPIVSNQVVYSLLERGIEKEVIPYCERTNTTVLAYSPLAEGKLLKNGYLTEAGVRALQQVAIETGKTVAQVSLNWCLYRPSVIAIVKASASGHIVDDCNASGWRLSKEQMQTLNKAFI
jgi:diketogulonate reductase-like aldo/keto reductase